MIRALLCKDLRLHALPTAGCWLALLGATWLAGSARFTYGVPLLVGVFAPTVIVAILGIVFFAGETDGGTEAFLHSLPVSRRAIWTARLVATLFHALLIACLSAWLIVRGTLSLPELAEVWKYNVQHWENLRFVLLCLPYAIVLCFTVSLSTGATSLSTRWGIIRYVVSLLLCIAVYVSLIAVSGTLGWDWRSGTGLDWLVASEVALAGVVACLAACRAFCSSAVGEPLNRLRRATITWVVATSVLALAILPFHCWANRTPPHTARVLWSPQLSPDGRFVVSEGWLPNWEGCSVSACSLRTFTSRPLPVCRPACPPGGFSTSRTRCSLSCHVSFPGHATSESLAQMRCPDRFTRWTYRRSTVSPRLAEKATLSRLR